MRGFVMRRFDQQASTHSPAPSRGAQQRLRVALLSYRSKPHCGGQGVYVRHLSRELVALGHDVEVFSGQPYPELDEGVTVDQGAEPRPLPRARPVPDAALAGVSATSSTCSRSATMWTGGFPEPLTFSLRVARLLERGRATSTSSTTTSLSAMACSRS